MAGLGLLGLGRTILWTWHQLFFSTLYGYIRNLMSVSRYPCRYYMVIIYNNLSRVTSALFQRLLVSRWHRQTEDRHTGKGSERPVGFASGKIQTSNYLMSAATPLGPSLAHHDNTNRENSTLYKMRSFTKAWCTLCEKKVLFQSYKILIWKLIWIWFFSTDI